MCFMRVILKMNLTKGGYSEMICHNTTIYNGLLRAIDEGRPVIVMDGYNGGVFYPYQIQVYSDNAISVMTSHDEFDVFPSDGYSSSALYTPQNITPTEQYSDGGGSHDIR